MSSLHHTPIATGAAANAATFNAPLSELDTVLAATTAEVAAARSPYTSLDARLDAFVFAGGNVATKANGDSVAAQKVLTVDATTGFIVGAYVAYLLDDTDLEYNVIDTIQAGVSLTLTTNIGTGGVKDDTYVAMISVSEYLAAQSVPHDGTLTLPQAVEYANHSVHNVLAYGASPAASAATNTSAFQAAIDAAEAVGGGVVEIPDGTFEFNGGLTITKSIILRGHGDYTRLLLKHATNDGITLNNGSDLSIIKNFTFYSDVERTAGAGLLIGGDAQVGNCRIENVLLQDLFVGIEIQQAVGTLIDNCRFMITPDNETVSTSQISVANIGNEDGGDNSISHCIFDVETDGVLTNHITWSTGSGLRLTNNKFLGAVTNHMYLSWNSTGDPAVNGGLFIATGNSFEGSPITSCINLGTTAGAFGSVVITGNEFAGLDATQMIRLSGSLSNVTISGNTFLATYLENVIGVNVVAVTGCLISGNTFTNVATGISITDSVSVVDCAVGQNAFHESRTAKVSDTGGRLKFAQVPEPFFAFQGNDLTPSVAGRSHWYTVNDTSTRTITMFDNGVAGQRIVVLVKDAYTKFDFTGTNLKGNAGADWEAGNGDWLEAYFDGTNWYCSVHDCTA
jgi:hypothetical protein